VAEEDFPARLRRLRQARGLTQRQLSGGQLSASYVSLLEAGHREPSPDVLATLAGALGVSVDELAAPAPRPSGADDQMLLVVRHGQLALADGQAPQAVELFRQALAGTDAGPLAQEAQLGLAQALQRTGNLEAAAAAYEKLVSDGTATPGTSSLRVLAGWLWTLYELGELDHAEEVGEHALTLLDEQSAWGSESAVRLLCTVALVRFELGDLRGAERLLAEGMQHAEAIDAPGARAAVLWNSSILAQERGHFRQAVELAEEALAIFRSGGDRSNVARMLTTLGHLLIRQEEPDAARARIVLQEAVDASAPTGVSRGEALAELARADLLLGDVGAARDQAQAALAQLPAAAGLERARATLALAEAQVVLDPAAAERLFAEAATTLMGLGASRQAAQAWTELADVLSASGRHEPANAAYRQATTALRSTRRARRKRPDSIELT
jgi:transcriptional regulator with XRE-family HTH domain